MSANALIVSVLLVLAVTAAALRMAAGPISTLKDADTLYARAKSGLVAGPLAGEVELAESAARPGR